jgi:hypothetical protein
MPAEHRALIGPKGELLGQAVLLDGLAITPLHVVDAERRGISCLDRSGKVDEIELTGVRAVDPFWDVIVFGTNFDVKCDDAITFAFQEYAGTEVEVHAVAGDGLAIVLALIRGQVEVEEHSYSTASGGVALASDVRVLFLSRPFAPGWSGAPVYLRGGRALVGFVHGNATANSGDGVCLMPDERGEALGLLRRHFVAERSRVNPHG